MSVQLDGGGFMRLGVKCGGCDAVAQVLFELVDVDAESGGYLYLTLGGGLPSDWTVVPFSDEVLCKQCTIEAEQEEAEYRQESLQEGDEGE